MQHRAGALPDLGSGHADGKVRHKEVLDLWVLFLLGLVRTSAGLQPQRLDLLHNELELSHLFLDETPGTWEQSLVFVPVNLTLP